MTHVHRRHRTPALLALCLGIALLSACAPQRTPEQVRATLLRKLPATLHDREGWASDIQTAFTALKLEPSETNLCAVLAVVAMLVMLDNVVSLGAKKTHYIEAGRWLSEHHQKTDAVFYDDPRVGYYAGWGYPKGQLLTVLDLQPEQIKHYQIFIVEADSDEIWLNDWMSRNGLRRAAQFANRKGDAVHVIVHAQQ